MTSLHRLRWLQQQYDEGRSIKFSTSFNPINRTEKLKFNLDPAWNMDNMLRPMLGQTIQSLHHILPRCIVVDKGHCSSRGASYVEFWIKKVPGSNEANASHVKEYEASDVNDAHHISADVSGALNPGDRDVAVQSTQGDIVAREVPELDLPPVPPPPLDRVILTQIREMSSYVQAIYAASYLAFNQPVQYAPPVDDIITSVLESQTRLIDAQNAHIANMVNVHNHAVKTKLDEISSATVSLDACLADFGKMLDSRLEDLRARVQLNVSMASSVDSHDIGLQTEVDMLVEISDVGLQTEASRQDVAVGTTLAVSSRSMQCDGVSVRNRRIQVMPSTNTIATQTVNRRTSVMPTSGTIATQTVVQQDHWLVGSYLELVFADTREHVTVLSSHLDDMGVLLFNVRNSEGHIVQMTFEQIRSSMR